MRSPFHPCCVFLLVLFAALVTAQDMDDDDDRWIAAAKIRTDKKKLQRLPRVQKFIQREANAYGPKLKLEFVKNHAPTLYWLNKEGRVVRQDPLDLYEDIDFDIGRKLKHYGIYKEGKNQK